MRFLVDNNLSPRLAVLLKQSGYDAIRVRDLGLAAADDETIFSAAASEGCVIVAQDTDFGTILAIRHASFPSVVLFRCQSKST